MSSLHADDRSLHNSTVTAARLQPGFSQLHRCLIIFAFIISIVIDTTMFLLNLSGFSHLPLHLLVYNLVYLYDNNKSENT